MINAKYGDTNLFCRTCDYTINIEKNNAISRKVYPKQKKVDDILEDMAYGGTTDAECPI